MPEHARSQEGRRRFVVGVVAGLVVMSVTFAVGAVTSGGPAGGRPLATTRSGVDASTSNGDPSIVLPQKSCDALADVDISTAVGAATSITSATTATAPEGFPICRITGVISPQIQFELRLPTQTWRQRYLQNGCNSFCGTLSIYSLDAVGCAPLTRGDFAQASTNEGHVGTGNNDGNFGTDPALRVDYAYRAQHLLAVASKALIQTFYGRRPAFSYFDGCSEGGRNGLQEARRYPTDFNGVIAGAPAALIEYLAGFFEAWLANADFDANGRQILPADKLPMLHNAVLAQCDGKDGLVDGQIDDPRACTFDPGTLVCPGTDASTCLTVAQVKVVRSVYSGPVDDGGKHLYPGGAPLGSELAWSPWFIPLSPTAPSRSTLASGIAAGWLKYLGFPTNPPLSFTLDHARFDRATFKRLSALAGLYDATDPDLSAFEHAGGKLILWHGWADQAITPFGTIAYYRALQDEMGGLTKVQQFARLFMVPGMNHCFGGDGPNTFDMVTPMLAWVEHGVAPTRVVAARTFNGVTRTRPVFPYPQVARYRGTGSIDDAANFVPKTPSERPVERFVWLGSFESHQQLWAHVRDDGLVLDHNRDGAL